MGSGRTRSPGRLVTVSGTLQHNAFTGRSPFLTFEGVAKVMFLRGARMSREHRTPFWPVLQLGDCDLTPGAAEGG